VYSNDDVGAECSSGSYDSLGMIIAPCSIKTMSEIASGVTASLMSRAADVALKERRRVVLMLRETPLHIGHIRSMAAVTDAARSFTHQCLPSMQNRPLSKRWSTIQLDVCWTSLASILAP
jgi:flavin prenyltransferase